MTKTEISEVSPDYIILDEFYRCGAQMWGQGVKNLLSNFPDIPGNYPKIGSKSWSLFEFLGINEAKIGKKHIQSQKNTRLNFTT